MRRLVLSLLVVAGFATFATQGRAQLTGDSFGDPFYLYYGWYLPRQAALAAQPRPEDTINAIAVQNQQAALAARSGLYDTADPFAMNYDPMAPFANQGTFGRRGVPPSGVTTTHIGGRGPAQYYNRTGTYYPARGMSAGYAARTVSRGSGALAGTGLSSTRRRGARGPTGKGLARRAANPMMRMPGGGRAYRRK